jgi:hypothetical protein
MTGRIRDLEARNILPSQTAKHLADQAMLVGKIPAQNIVVEYSARVSRPQPYQRITIPARREQGRLDADDNGSIALRHD